MRHFCLFDFNFLNFKWVLAKLLDYLWRWSGECVDSNFDCENCRLVLYVFPFFKPLDYLSVDTFTSVPSSFFFCDVQHSCHNEICELCEWQKRIPNVLFLVDTMNSLVFPNSPCFNTISESWAETIRFFGHTQELLYISFGIGFFRHWQESLDFHLWVQCD